MNEVTVRPCAGPEEYPRLVAIWRSAVDATHDFLADDDRARIEELLPTAYLPHVRLFVAERAGRVVGFAGVSGASLEMLFVDAADRGSGVGSALLAHVVDECGVTTVDVNEQNTQAVGFYARAGFTVTGRSPVDDEGRPYPLLHLALTR
ncbi:MULTISPECIES: acetyltransferase [unclassified Isoptericola]|uniref:acetyltransferase n=1 Tax=unclassified Isoptericola TaxID=2623355 RepID=UPI00365A3714